MSKNLTPELAPQDDRSESPEQSELYIVGIGASAGGLDSLEKFFQNMPADSGVAFVVIQHLSPNFKSMMGELLARHTEMTILQAGDGLLVEPNHIYLIPPRKDMVIKDRQLFLSDRKEGEQLHLPIDTFFQSLARDVGKHAISIIMSGTGSDGSRGISTVSQANGFILAQDEVSAGFDGMPRSAIVTGLVDIVCPPEEMPRHVLEYLQHPSYRMSNESTHDVVQEENEISLIFAILQKRFKIDFSQYKLATILRRINRRMMLTNVQDGMKYISRLENDPDEINSLYRDLLVEVTQFFRDPEAFEALKDQIIPEIVEQSQDNDEIRVWVPGCATGEEAYSIAILFQAYLDEVQIRRDVKVFATDMHQQSLDAASAGVFSEASVQNIPDEFLSKYFNRMGDDFQINKQLRRVVIFAQHNLIHDPPFTKLDLISCRNVLIYFQQAAQNRVLSRFHFGLKTGGYLFLGASEYVGELEAEFRTVNRRWRFFNKWREVRLPEMSEMARSPVKMGHLQSGLSATRERRFYRDDWAESLLRRFVPDGFLVNESFELVHVFGNGRQFLNQPIGDATLNVLRMLDDNLQMAVRAAVHQASKSDEEVFYSGVQFDVEGMTTYLKLSVAPIHGRHQTTSYFLIYFVDDQTSQSEQPKPQQVYSVSDEEKGHVRELERELVHTKEYLQTTIEELETTNEELQSSNEELIASNEELQSTNEELHSVNEELHTVNAEHQRKIEELSQLTNDMKNLQRSSGVGVVFLNDSLQIREFTPTAAQIFNLFPQDIGRPIEHLLYRIPMSRESLVSLAKQVLSTETTISKEIALTNDQFYLMQALPYRNENNEIYGLVLTFTDISELKIFERELAHQEEQYQMLFEHTPFSIWVEDYSKVKGYIDSLKNEGVSDFGTYFANHPENLQHCAELISILDVNSATLKMFGAKNKEDLYRSLPELFDKNSWETFKNQIVALAEGKTHFTEETTNRTIDGHVIDIYLSLAISPMHMDDWGHVYLSMANISEQKRAEREVQLSEAQYKALSSELDLRVQKRTKELEAETAALLTAQQALETSRTRLELAVEAVGLGIYEHTVPLDETTYHSEKWAELLGFTLDELPVPNDRLDWVFQQIHLDDIAILEQSYASFVSGKSEEFDVVVRMKHKHGNWVYIRATSKALARNENGEATHILGSMRDVTKLKESEIAYMESLEKYQSLNEELESRVLERTQEIKEANKLLKIEIDKHHFTAEMLANSEQQFSDFIEFLPGGILIVNEEGAIVEVNDAVENLFGYEKNELIGQSVEILVDNEHKKNHVDLRTVWLEAPENRLMWDGRHVNGKHKNGHSIPLLIDLSFVHRADGLIVMAHISDMTEIQKSERRLTERAEALTQSNEELENFAYVVSHDLRAPLRAMKGYSTFLKEDYGDTLDEEGIEFILGIHENASRMDQLLLDILTYSRISRLEEPPSRINMQQFFVDFIDSTFEKNGVQFSIAENLPILESYPTRITQIFGNLLTNAVKYSAEVNEPKVWISYVDLADTHAFTIVDNGIGIDEAHFERIFGVFQRLHTDDEYDGTGIGLAIVKKAVEMIGGSIQVKSKVQEGSSFIVTLPKEIK